MKLCTAFSLSGWWRLRLWHISSHSSHFSYRHSSPMTTPSPAHSVVYYVLLFFLLLLHFCHSSDGTIEAMERKDRPFVGWDLRDEMTWIIITATRLMFLLLFFLFLSNRKLVGTNVSPHFLFLSHPHGHPRTSAFFSPADFSILFDWPFLFSRLQPSEPTSLFPTKLNPRSPPVLDGRSMDEQAGIQQRLMAVMEISHASLTAPAKNHRRIWRAPFILYSSITIPSTVTLQSPYIKFIMIHTASYCGWMDGWMDRSKHRRMGGGGGKRILVASANPFDWLLCWQHRFLLFAKQDVIFSLSLSPARYYYYYYRWTFSHCVLYLCISCIMCGDWLSSSTDSVQFRIVWFIYYDSVDSPSESIHSGVCDVIIVAQPANYYDRGRI